MSSILVLILVVFFFYILTKNYNKTYYKHYKPQYSRNFNDALGEEVVLLVSMIAKVAKADGRVCELEAEVISSTLTKLSSHFNDSKSVREQLKLIYEQEKRNDQSVRETANKYLSLVNGDYQRCYEVVEFLLNLAFIDGNFSPSEQLIVEEVAKTFGIEANDYDELVAYFKSFYKQRKTQTSKNPYEVLGISENASLDEIKQKYRQLVKENHPDILMGQGKSQTIINKATEKLQDINSAYEEIKKKFE